MLLPSILLLLSRLDTEEDPSFNSELTSSSSVVVYLQLWLWMLVLLSLSVYDMLDVEIERVSSERGGEMVLSLGLEDTGLQPSWRTIALSAISIMVLRSMASCFLEKYIIVIPTERSVG
jgi:hypothetical protein